MNVTSEKSISIWMDTKVVDEAPVLDRDEQADVAVVGSGIAGLAVAHELTKAGKNVVVVDRGPIGKGMTARTTAHLATVCDDGFERLISTRGEDAARLWYQSHAAAIDCIENNQRELGIDCDFRRLDGVLFLAAETDTDIIEKEYEAARRFGIRAFRQTGTPFQGQKAIAAVCYPGQATFHPLKYLSGLAAAIRKSGSRFYADTPVKHVEEKGSSVEVRAGNHIILAQYAVVATNSPINDKYAIHSKQAPYRTYAMAFEVPKRAIPDALYWDTCDPYHYVRLQPASDGRDILIVGGEDHKSGEADDAQNRFEALQAWMRQLVPALGQELRRWSGQVQEPVDHCAFIGRNPGEERTFIVTGDSGQGITHGVVAGLLIADLIVKGESPWTQVYEPSRKPTKAAGTLISENLTVLKNFAEYLAPGEVSSWDDLQPGHGAIVRQGARKLAAYRDDSGRLFLRSAACSHLGCHVHWNSFERCWDCPCHGSQFAPDGAVLSGPAISALPEVEA